MGPSVVNNGEACRLTVGLTATCETIDGSTLFDLGNLQIDWSNFQAALTGTFAVKPTDTIAIALTNLNAQVVIVSTDVPVQVNFTQDGISRSTRVKPLVDPIAYFAGNPSPSDVPNDIQRGVSILNGDITALSLVGLAGMPSANVRVYLAGYRT